MKKPTETKPRTRTKRSYRQYVFYAGKDGWFAHGLDNNSGSLVYDEKTQEYTASGNEDSILFPKLASGKYSSQADCPIDQNHRPKADFLLLLALRESFPTHSPGRVWNALKWSEKAIQERIAEREKIRGNPLPEKNLVFAREIAASWSKFESYVGKWLADISQKQGAGQIFRRLAGWLDAIEKIEKEGVPPSYQKFFRAVEEAAKNAQGIPTQKAVRTIYEKGMSISQLGAGTGFDTLKDRLGFEWLPAGRRGPAARGK
jgi:hypothetical protein